jgi:hypothetical protein
MYKGKVLVGIIDIALYVRVGIFFLEQNTKTGENIPNGHKKFSMAVK